MSIALNAPSRVRNACFEGLFSYQKIASRGAIAILKPWSN